MNLINKKILVIGADGFIGSHLTEYLLNRGYKVKAFCFYNSFGSWGWLDYLEAKQKSKLEVFLGDIRDPVGVKTAMQGCQVVLHLAALISIPFSYYSPASYVETNVIGTLNVVQSARELGIEKVVVTSTSEVYGTAQIVPITEEHPLQGQSPYAASKIGADQIALSYYRSFGVPIAVIRPFNTYGPRQSARAVIPTIITQINNGKKSIHLGALHPTRDFNYVEDVVRGFLAVAECDKAVGEVFNIGSNFEISIGETAKIVQFLMKKKVKIVSQKQRLRPDKSEVERLWADNRKAVNILKWEPDYGGREGFIAGLEKTINWFTNPVYLKMYKSDVYNI